MAEKPYARIGETLSILEVMSLGKAIVLSDYSSWRVRWIHKWKAAFWSINQNVVVIGFTETTKLNRRNICYKVQLIDKSVQLQHLVVGSAK